MALTFTPHGEHFGGRADQIAIALCGQDLSRIYAVIAAGFQVHHYVWDSGEADISPVIDKPSAVGGSNVAATFAAHDRLLAAFKSGGKFHFRAFDDSLNLNPQRDEKDVSPAYLSVTLAGIPRPDHLLWPGSGPVPMQGNAPPGTATTSTPGTVPLTPKTPTVATPAKGFKLSIGPKIAYAAMAAVSADFKLRVGIWGMDWHGQVRTNLGQTKVSTAEPANQVSVATVTALWEKDHLKKADFVTASINGNSVGPLKLICWRRDSSASASIAKVSEMATGEQAKAIALAQLKAGANAAVVSALIDGAGNLKVIAWKLGVDGVFTRGAEATGEAITMLRCVWAGDRDVVTAVKLADGTLKLIYWRFSETGPAVRLGEKAIHTIGFGLSLAHRPGTGNDLGETFVAMNLANGDLKLARFGVVES